MRLSIQDLSWRGTNCNEDRAFRPHLKVSPGQFMSSNYRNYGKKCKKMDSFLHIKLWIMCELREYFVYKCDRNLPYFHTINTAKYVLPIQ